MAYPSDPHGQEEVQPGPPPWEQHPPPYPPQDYAAYPPPGYATPPDGGPYGYGAAPPPESWPPAADHGGRSRRRTLALVAVIAVVGVVALLVLLNFEGVFVFLPGSSPGSGSKGPTTTPTALTFSQAEGIANQTATQRGGGWAVALGIGIQASTAFNPSTTEPCSTSAYSPASSAVGLSGEAYEWGFIYTSTPFVLGGWDKALFVVVANDSATVTTEVLPGTGCPGIGFPVAGPLPTNISNSPGVAAAAYAAGGEGFLSAHPGASLLLLAGALPASGNSYTPVWLAEYEGTCSPSTSTLPEFGADLYGSDLHVFSHGWGNESCTPGTPPYDPVTFTSVSSGHSTVGSVYFDNLTVSAPSGFTTADLGLAILESNKTLVGPGTLPSGCYDAPSFSGCSGASSSGGWYALLRSNGAIVGAYPSSTGEIQWSTGSSSASITSSDTLELVSISPLHGSGDSLLAFTWSDSADVWGSATL
jgi:hypothetical protein